MLFRSVLLREPLAHVTPADVDRILNPAAAALGARTSGAAVGVGATATHATATLSERLGSLAGGDSPTAETTLRTALWLLTATTGLVLVAVVLA